MDSDDESSSTTAAIGPRANRLAPAELLAMEEEGVTTAILSTLEDLSPYTKKAHEPKWAEWNKFSLV